MAEAAASARPGTEDAFLDAAERLLVEVGCAGVTTRRVAEEAGANKGLVHYYFGSMENLLVRVLERFTERLIARHRAMYAADVPFIEKWREAMRYLDEDFESGYQKVWYELQALSWSRPELRDRVARVTEEWYRVLTEAYEQARREHAIEIPRDALVTLVATFNQGIILERLSGIDTGHRALLDWIDGWLEGATMTTIGRVTAAEREQTRARYPDQEGYVERDGVRVSYEVYGDGDPTILFVPPWAIVHSRCWKMQIPYFARHCRVVTFDPRGNGKSDRPREPAAYSEDEYAADALAVLDATETRQAVLVTLSLGAQRSLILAAEHSERIRGAVFIEPSLAIAPGHDYRSVYPFDAELDVDEGWAKFNAHYWLRDYPGFVEFFMSQCLTEPHSTKQTEDAIGWGLETDGETLLTLSTGRFLPEEEIRDLCARVRCPVLVIHGDADAISPHTRGAALAEATGGTLVTIEGGGHFPQARDPVEVNLLIRDFVCAAPPSRQWVRAKSRRKRALYVSSPIGLGHAQRDVAIADELRKVHPDLEIDWLAQHPVTAVLEARGERIHPGSAYLANESGHIESESAEHDLHCFQAIRRMDEILLSNFMVFHDVVREEQYDVWIGDEAWELDYYLHENPEQKRAAYVWLTDFVGWLPMTDGGEREAFVTADYNAEMIEHIARFPRVRDRAIFVGNAADIVPDDFGPGLPPIRDWTEEHFSFAGYITGFDPSALGDRALLRAELGYGEDEQVCIVTVGGSGVGGDLLRRVIDAYPEAKERVPELRMIVVAGPRIDPASLPSHEGLEVRRYVHELYRHLAACNLAVVQGGLTTGMELTANRRPFLYFPLRHHFEQNLHVRHRLERYGAGRRMDFETATPDVVAAAIAEEIGREVDYQPVETDGAARAAALIAELL